MLFEQSLVYEINKLNIRKENPGLFRMWSTVKELSGFALATIPVSYTILGVYGYVARVDGTSMQPTLNPDARKHDWVFLNNWKARKLDFTRGEIVSLVSPLDPKQRLIKRVLALEGDIVRTLSYKNRYVKVPKGHCWVEGDNHSHSVDSNTFGPIPLGLLKGQATRIVWPPRRFGVIVPENPESERVRGEFYEPRTVSTQFGAEPIQVNPNKTLVRTRENR